MDHDQANPPTTPTTSAADDTFLLRNSDPAYQQTLLKGVSFVLNGIIAMIIMVIISVAVRLASTGGQPATAPAITPLDVGLQMISFAIGLVIAYGWWLFSESDPRLTGEHAGGSARQVVRVCIAINVVASALSFVLYLLAWITGAALLAGIMLIGIGLVAGIAGIVAFFAQMLYVKWLAPRLPNEAVYKRSKTLMWLGPVLYTVGALLIVGPLIALVLYWNMLDKVRKDLKGIVGAGGGGFPTPA